MSDAALSIGLFDPEHGLNVSARAGATLLFEGGRADIRDQGPEIKPTRKGWEARLGQDFEVKLEPVAEGAALGQDVTVHVCRVSGRIGGQKARCLGTVAETHRAPAWEELDVLRSIAAVFDSENAFLALASRSRGALGHDAEQVSGWLLSEGEVVDLTEVRLSTVYDGNGRQRSAGLELWRPDQDFPQRGSGSVVAGTSLAMEGLEVHAAAFRWRMEDREGAGAYELWLRSEPEPA